MRYSLTNTRSLSITQTRTTISMKPVLVVVPDAFAVRAETAADRAEAAQTEIDGRRVATVITYSDGLPATESIALPTGGNLVKTYHYDSDGNPVTADWNYPTGTDYVETFTYDADGNPTGSTFEEA